MNSLYIQRDASVSFANFEEELSNFYNNNSSNASRKFYLANSPTKALHSKNFKFGYQRRITSDFLIGGWLKFIKKGIRSENLNFFFEVDEVSKKFGGFSYYYFHESLEIGIDLHKRIIENKLIDLFVLMSPSLDTYIIARDLIVQFSRESGLPFEGNFNSSFTHLNESSRLKRAYRHLVDGRFRLGISFGLKVEFTLFENIFPFVSAQCGYNTSLFNNDPKVTSFLPDGRIFLGIIGIGIQYNL